MTTKSAEAALPLVSAPAQERRAATLFIISGMADVDLAGNQSMKNTIKYLSEFGYQIHVFAAFPKNYRILQDPKTLFNPHVVFHRSPNFLIPVFDLAKTIKDWLGRSGSREKHIQELRPCEKVRYYDEYNFLGRMFYALFLLLYLPLETMRVLFYYFRLKPRLFYGINGQGCAAASLVGTLLRKPIVHRWQGMSYTEEDIKNFKHRFWHKLLLLDGGFAKMAPSDAVVVTNDGTQGDKIYPLLKVDPRKLYFWMNGLDTEDLTLPLEWDPLRFKASLGLEDRKVLMMASRLVLWKRVDRGIHCVHQLVHRYGVKNFLLLVIGHGQELEKLKRWAAHLEIENWVQFVGSVPHREIAKYYSISDVFLSLYDVSNLGNPLLEAMYFGLPIVSIDDGSTEELLREGDNAFLVPHGSLDTGLPARVKTLLENESLRRTLGQKARRTFDEKVLSWRERMLLEHPLIEKLIREGSALR